MRKFYPKPTADDKIRNYRQFKELTPKNYLVSIAKSRAKKKGLEFDITIDDIEIPDVCPFLKTPFVSNTMYAMSIDRINNDQGYVKGNVEVISRKANTMKSNCSSEELLDFAYEILERY